MYVNTSINFKRHHKQDPIDLQHIFSMTETEIPKAKTGPPGQPDIAYTPNPETYRARVQRRLAKEDLPRTLPDGFPQKLESELVWDGATVSAEYEWSYQLTDHDVGEVHQALEHFKNKIVINAQSMKMTQSFSVNENRPWYPTRTNLTRDFPTS